MKEKLEEANKVLYEETPIVEVRSLKVKFREVLVDYEPDLTDDDVQSIESYNEVDYILDQEFVHETVPQQLPNKIELNIFTPTLNMTEEEEEEQDEETENEDLNIEDDIIQIHHTDPSRKTEELGPNRNAGLIIESQETLTEQNSITDEEIEEKIDLDPNKDTSEDVDLSSEDSQLSPSSISDEEIEEFEDIIRQTDETSETKEESTSAKTVTPSSSRRSSVMMLSRKLSKVDCKEHCIERLDTQLDLTISKLQISERPLCPALKLMKRRCCEKNQVKNEQKLPCYSGLRSEYGLSLQQLEKRQRRKEQVRIREERRKQLMEEYKNRKIQQNEEIFSQWLKNIQKRKEEQALKRRSNKKAISPKILEISNKSSEKIERPKTSYPLMPTHNVKKLKRPNTSTTCVFIQVPQNALRKGFHVGDILVTDSKNVPAPKGLHILSFS